MARRFLMTWEGAPAYRWKKMRAGTMYRVSCADLGLPIECWTQEASYQAANDWWTKKLAAESPPVTSSIESVLSNIVRTNKPLAHALIHGQEEALDTVLAMVQGPDKANAQAKIIGSAIDSILTPAPLDFALQTQSARFLAIERARNKKPRTYGELSESIAKIIATPPLHPTMDVRNISERTVQDFFLTLQTHKRAGTQKKKFFSFFRRLVRFIWASRLIELPRNLNERIFRFQVSPKRIKTYDVREMKECLVELKPRLKLYALLALNCGMLGVDIANILHSEVDKRCERIKRKRTKTEEQADVPIVDYKLWKATAALLRANLSDHDEYVLTSKAGTKLAVSKINDDGKETEKDLIRQQWKRGEPKPKFPLKAFRTMGSTVIGNAPDYGGRIEYTRYYHHYLGHSPKGIADRNYVPPSREMFDEIIMWVGSVFGLK